MYALYVGTIIDNICCDIALRDIYHINDGFA